MIAVTWYVLVGFLLVGVAFARTKLANLPLSLSLIYLCVGVALSPLGLGLLDLDPVSESALLVRIAEIAVIISVFTAGLKLRVPLRSPRWRVPLQLASLSMVLTVGLVALVGVIGLGLSVGAALVLGAILAPTDPVLASDVQMRDPSDEDDVRFSLTGEAGMNDGTAFPFLMLGLGVLGLHELGDGGWRWLLVDVVWATAGGLAVGALLGWLTARFVLYLRREHREAVGVDDFLALGLITLSYGLALLLHAYGFLAVFAAGLALRQVELAETPADSGDALPLVSDGTPEEEVATDQTQAPGYLARAVLQFNEQLEHLGEVVVVILIGAMLFSTPIPASTIWFAPLLLLGIRPLAVLVGTLGTGLHGRQRALIAWFGIRGIGSIYYLMFAIEQGLEAELAEGLTAITLALVAISVVVHGVSVTPLMTRHAAAEADAKA